MRAKQHLMETVLALPEKERLEMVEALLGSLSSQAKEMSDDNMKAELDRRWQEYQADPSSALTWEEVKTKARKKSR